MPYNAMYSFIETKLFTRLVTEYLSDEDYRELQSELILNVNAGDVVPGVQAEYASSDGGRAAEGSAAATGSSTLRGRRRA